MGGPSKALQASTKSGAALYFRPHQGATNELPSFMETVETLATSLPPGLVVVAGSGLGYIENLCVLDSSKVGFVVPLRAGTDWAERFKAEVPGGLRSLHQIGTAHSASSVSPIRNAPSGRVCCALSR